MFDAMVTFLTILCVLIVIFGIAHDSHVDDIIEMSRPQLYAKKKEDSRTALKILLVSVAVLALGIILYKCTDLYKTVQVKSLFGNIKEARRWTSSNYWALILTFLGSIGTMVGMIASIRNLVALGKYSSMSDSEYSQLQEQLIQKREKERKELKQAKQARTGFKIGQFLANLLFG